MTKVNSFKNNDLIFTIDDKAYIFTKIWTLMLMVSGLVAIYMMFGDFMTLIEHDEKFIIFYLLMTYIIVSDGIKLIYALYKKDNKIKFYKDKIVTTYKPRTISLVAISNIESFNTLFQYDGRRRLSYKGITKVILNIALIGIGIMIIAYPIVLVSAVYITYFYILSLFIYLYLYEIKFINFYKMRMLDISENSNMITILLDGSSDDKKIKEYFQNYGNINLHNIKRKIIFRD